ncbi:hypothetical protein [Streptomyces sp. NPDC088816]
MKETATAVGMFGPQLCRNLVAEIRCLRAIDVLGIEVAVIVPQP